MMFELSPHTSVFSRGRVDKLPTVFFMLKLGKTYVDKKIKSGLYLGVINMDICRLLVFVQYKGVDSK